ncbi:MAG TPA: ribosome assembly factor SBDS, partial [Candidatus Nanoarchaeia archaeon]|nr:ribosome assembly factor SBDS [Candidatus Nanoarchaeia archaeon]
MVDVDKAVIARLKTSGKKFEILVDCDKAIELKQGKNVNLNDVLATDAIFTDVKKGNKAPEKELEDSFGTSDALEISEEIIKKGEVQLTQDHMNKL